MPAIARLAGVAPPLIHYHFDSKENLWREAVEHSLGQLRSETAAVLRATRSIPAMDRLRSLLQVHAEFAAQFPDHFSMIVAEARADSARFAWLHEQFTGHLFDELLSLLVDARDAGAIRDVALRELAVVLIGGVLVHFTIYPRKDAAGIADAAPSFVDTLFDFLRGVIVPQA